MPQKRYTNWEEEEAHIKRPKSRRSKSRKVVESETETETEDEDSDVVICEDAPTTPVARKMRESRKAKSAANLKFDSLAKDGHFKGDSDTDSDFAVGSVSKFHTPVSNNRKFRKKGARDSSSASSQKKKSERPNSKDANVTNSTAAHEKSDYFETESKSPCPESVRSPPAQSVEKAETLHLGLPVSNNEMASPSAKPDWWKSPIAKKGSSAVASCSTTASSSQDSGVSSSISTSKTAQVVQLKRGETIQ